MKLIPMLCPACRAPLEPPKGAPSLRCEWCQTPIDRIPPPEHRPSEHRGSKPTDVADYKRRAQGRLAELDQAWMSERESLLHMRNGEGSIPSPTGAMAGGGFAAVFGVLWTIFAISMGAPWFFAAFGVVFVVVALRGGIRAHRRAAKFIERQEEFQRKRRELLGEG